MPAAAFRQKLILASRSPRRRELLAQAGYRFEVFPPDEAVEDGAPETLAPEALVADLARRKAADVARQIPTGVILGCDTVVACDGRILGKPDGPDDATRMLQTLRGREHWALTGVCLWKKPGRDPMVRVARTTLRMEPLSDAHISRYVAGGGWQGKAGAFGIQDRPGWIRILEGSESNVIGLPLELLAEMLAEIQA